MGKWPWQAKKALIATPKRSKKKCPMISVWFSRDFCRKCPGTTQVQDFWQAASGKSGDAQQIHAQLQSTSVTGINNSWNWNSNELNCKVYRLYKTTQPTKPRSTKLPFPPPYFCSCVVYYRCFSDPKIALTTTHVCTNLSVSGLKFVILHRPLRDIVFIPNKIVDWCAILPLSVYLPANSLNVIFYSSSEGSREKLHFGLGGE